LRREAHQDAGQEGRSDGTVLLVGPDAGYLMQSPQRQATLRQRCIDGGAVERQNCSCRPSAPLQRLETASERRQALAPAPDGHDARLTLLPLYLFIFCSNKVRESSQDPSPVLRERVSPLSAAMRRRVRAPSSTPFA